jgi:hypothetical protein
LKISLGIYRFTYLGETGIGGVRQAGRQAGQAGRQAMPAVLTSRQIVAFLPTRCFRSATTDSHSELREGPLTRYVCAGKLTTPCESPDVAASLAKLGHVRRLCTTATPTQSCRIWPAHYQPSLLINASTMAMLRAASRVCCSPGAPRRRGTCCGDGRGFAMRRLELSRRNTVRASTIISLAWVLCWTPELSWTLKPKSLDSTMCP